MSDAHTLLAAEAVTAGYRGLPKVLVDASMTVTSGGRLALMGANGSGKTTLLRVLSGAHEPAAGRVSYRGEKLKHRPGSLTTHRQRVQLVLQDPDDQLFSADVRADVSFGPLNLGLSDAEALARVDEALALLEIVDLADRPVHQLSYGQRKRVAIAGAVAMRPEVLLLDEPTAGLDPVAVKQLLNTWGRLQAAGTTVVVATHDVDLAWQWADQVAVVHDASVWQGPTAEILTDQNLLAAARLDVPWQVQILQQAGVEIPSDNPPRTAVEIARLLR
ncbi:energy-coupling factor ABC transporter ATP-binding protein [Enemella sp. A6]|uniref:energy-coupling factor ABC transporter ATP-binding protein n=1 Tax=Enemella sp. A6 TaxID=3440152 RepID=UPI003EBFEABD